MEQATVKLADLFSNFPSIFLDTALVIYYVDGNSAYQLLVDSIFDTLDRGDITGITSPITLAECLVHPYRKNDSQRATVFANLIFSGQHIQFVEIGQEVVDRAAMLRAKYRLQLPDALQLAVALVSRCDVFLTNDARLKQISEVRVLLLDDLEP